MSSGSVPDVVVVESEEVQVGHLVDAGRDRQQLVVVQAQLHHGLVRAEERLGLDRLPVQSVVGEVEVLDARLHVGEDETWGGRGGTMSRLSRLLKTL